MSDVSELEARQLADAFRPNRKPLWIAVIANLSMALLLLGVPYWRGQRMGVSARSHFAEFTRCLLGGEIASQPGLSLPRGERDHFAAKVMFAEPAWPLSCRAALRKLAPPEAIFLWPSVKQAGADVRAAVELVERELVALDKRRKRGQGRIPVRPLDAFARLQAASVLYVRAAGADSDVDNDAIRFDGAARGLAAPARLPLMATQTSTLQVWSSELALEALAIDGRGVSYLRVADGKIDRERLRRTSFTRGVVRAGTTPYVVWAMPEARCKEREDRCAGRPTGIAAYNRGGNSLADPEWKLAGHPAGRLDRVLQMSELGRVDLVGRTSPEGALELLRFRLPERAPDTPGENKQAPTLEPTEHWPLTAAVPASSVALLAAEPSAVLQTSDGEQGVSATLNWAAARQPLQLPAAAGAGGWGLGCTLGTNHYLTYGSRSQLRVVRVAEGADVHELLIRDVALLPALHDENPALDQVRLVCGGASAHLLLIDAQHELQWSSCDETTCQPSRSIARDVTGFSALSDAQGLVVAYAGILEAAVVRVARMVGNSVSTQAVPAACWDPLGGMCGTPNLVGDAQRLVLTAYDGSDLLALESRDHGQTFTTLSGLVVSSGFEPSTTSPLQQHRKRKGLE